MSLATAGQGRGDRKQEAGDHREGYGSNPDTDRVVRGTQRRGPMKGGSEPGGLLGRWL